MGFTIDPVEKCPIRPSGMGGPAHSPEGVALPVSAAPAAPAGPWPSDRREDSDMVT